MIKWKLFGKSKDTEKIEPEKDVQEPIQEVNETVEDLETLEETEEKPLAEYHETLQSGKPRQKKFQESYDSDQRIWRDVSLIEDKIDKLHKTRAEKPITEIDKKVDKLIIDVDVDKKETPRKTANVIYVVSKPQPGQVRGDWAVRDHGKIYSHHRKKQTAI